MNQAEATTTAIGSAGLSSPPRPPLVFRVGAVGHRPRRLDKADPVRLNEVLDHVLGCLADEVPRVPDAERYAEGPATLRAISCLAEGVDRAFLERAQALHFEPCAVLPFPRREYERDFAAEKAHEADSLSRFRRLVDACASCLELDGSRAEEARAYGRAGEVVANQSDVLLVVWDGRREGRPGGTESVLESLLRRRSSSSCATPPIVWVDAQAPHDWQVLDPSSGFPPPGPDGRAVPRAGQDEALKAIVGAALSLPAAPHGDPEEHRSKARDPREDVEDFYGEKRPARSLAFVWPVFRALVGDLRIERPRVGVPDFEEAVLEEWPADRSTPLARLVDRLRPTYAWADRLAVLYADRYRSAFVSCFLLGACAVAMALLPVALELEPHSLGVTVCSGLELAILVTALALVFLGRGRRWHERWIDYRLAAEMLGGLPLFALLGGARPAASMPAHLARYGNPYGSWMAWYVRAVERWLGFTSAVVDAGLLVQALMYLRAVLQRQVQFHEDSAHRAHRMETRLHYTGFALLCLTAVCCVLHFRHELPEGTGPALTFLCGVLPAFGAALAAISNQGEFRRIQKRSTAMKESLEQVLGELMTLGREEAGVPPVLSAALSDVAARAAHLRMSEVLDWRVVFLDQPLRPPA